MKKFLALILILALTLSVASAAYAAGIFGGGDEEGDIPLGDPADDVLSPGYDPEIPLEEIPLSAPTADGLSLALVAFIGLASLAIATVCIKKARA